jgi:hypothetical protein
MNRLMATAAFLILSVAAGAKPAPVGDYKSIEDQTPTLARNDAAINDAAINVGSAGAAREREYFQAPQMHFNAGSFSCRSQSSVFNKTRLAQSCD